MWRCCCCLHRQKCDIPKIHAALSVIRTRLTIDSEKCVCFFPRCLLQGTMCAYRHEPLALGHEQMCPKWKVGQCLDAKCPNRHMIIEKARSKIQCYWESKPGGCCKPHCVFKHTKRQNNNNSITTSTTIDTPEAVPKPVDTTASGETAAHFTT